MSSNKRRRKQRQAKNLCQLEPLMQGVKAALTHDLYSPNMVRICRRYERGKDIPGILGFSPYLFKKFQQVRNFDKRIIWSSDRPFSELADESFRGFVDSQAGFNLPEPMSRRASLVLHHAANICQLILGEFDYNEWFDSCSYGKRAAFKLPRSVAYLDTRVKRVSGTATQIAAFNQCLSRDPHLLRAVREGRKLREVCDFVKATAVPKSFKSARIIAPDTILGGFLSTGIGNMIRKRLEEGTHINLAKQQFRHRRWAQKASINGHYATIDMSKASDSFVWRHIECLVPFSWHHALDCVRTRTVEVRGVRYPLASYMLMGSGHTFPLQTLLFYCLAEATRTLLKCRGRVSVYGDDIIIPTRMSNQLISLFGELGFTINSSKSFYDEPDADRPSHSFFRESCGGDYKGGVDVRPYMPECDLQRDGQVPANEYLAWVHKIINGLLDHWDPCEIPITLGYLLRTINNRKRKICFVPSWEVDHAGIRHYIPPSLTFGLDVSLLTYEASYPQYWKLTFHRKKRKRTVRERPYVWYAYFLKRNQNSVPGRIFALEHLLLEETMREFAKSYDPPVSLNGEPRRDLKGVYRWTCFGPQNPEFQESTGS